MKKIYLFFNLMKSKFLGYSLMSRKDIVSLKKDKENQLKNLYRELKREAAKKENEDKVNELYSDIIDCNNELVKVKLTISKFNSGNSYFNADDSNNKRIYNLSFYESVTTELNKLLNLDKKLKISDELKQFFKREISRFKVLVQNTEKERDSFNDQFECIKLAA